MHNQFLDMNISKKAILNLRSFVNEKIIAHCNIGHSENWKNMSWTLDVWNSEPLI